MSNVHTNNETFDAARDHAYRAKGEHSDYLGDFDSLVLGWLIGAAKPEDVRRAVEHAHRVMGISR